MPAQLIAATNIAPAERIPGRGSGSRPQASQGPRAAITVAGGLVWPGGRALRGHHTAGLRSAEEAAGFSLAPAFTQRRVTEEGHGGTGLPSPSHWSFLSLPAGPAEVLRAGQGSGVRPGRRQSPCPVGVCLVDGGRCCSSWDLLRPNSALPLLAAGRAPHLPPGATWRLLDLLLSAVVAADSGSGSETPGDLYPGSF